MEKLLAKIPCIVSGVIIAVVVLILAAGCSSTDVQLDMRITGQETSLYRKGS